MNRFAMRLTVILAVFLLASGAVAQRLPNAPEAPELASGFIAKTLSRATQHMVAAANPLAVEAGLSILDRGGSATDAAIAVQMVLNLVEPQSSGIGGGGFLLHYDARQKVTIGYDGREAAPMAATADLFIGNDGQPLRFYEAVIGGRSVGVPGVLRALETAHAKHGKLPWAALFDTAIALAENGFALSQRAHTLIAGDRALRNTSNTRDYFYQSDGAPKSVGTILKNPQFAEVLRRIAKEGAGAFYTGTLAKEIVAAVRGHPTNPGTLDEKDLADYRAHTVEPLCAPYRRFRLCGLPPTSGSLTVLQIMLTLEGFNMKAVRPHSADAVHLISEAGRLAFADRTRYLADERFTSAPIAGLLDSAYNNRRRELIRREKTMGRAVAGEPAGATVTRADDESFEFASTSHLSVVDKDGNAVSMTTSIESAFGSRIWVNGFLLNNTLTDFSAIATDQGLPVANAVQPGKRPRSAMSPTLVFDADNRLHMIIGSPGGPAIINYVAKTLVATLDWGMDIQAAISLPNFGSRNGPTEIEKGSSLENLSAILKSMGHEVRSVEMTSGLHGIMRTSTGWQGGADPRREGIAKGK